MSAAIRWLLQGLSFQTKDEKKRVASIPFKIGNDAEYRAAIDFLDRGVDYERKYYELVEVVASRTDQAKGSK